MLKTSKIAILVVIVIAIATIAPASAYFSTQNTEIKAERIVDIADEALDTVMDLVQRIEDNASTVQLIEDAELDDEFYGNVSLCVEEGTEVNGTAVTESGEGWTYLNASKTALANGEYENATDNAREALSVFRGVLRSINDILVDAGVETSTIIDASVIQEAIERSENRIEELQNLLADEELLGNLTEAEDLLTNAQELLDAGEIEEAKEALIEANSIISYVCRQLRRIAQELNPSRIKGYLDEAYRRQGRFRERFGQAWNENFDVDGFLQRYGYQNEEEFMNQYQELLEKAQNAENIEEAIENLKEIGQTIRKMDSAFIQEFGHFRGGQGYNMPGGGRGFGNMGGGNSP